TAAAATSRRSGGAAATSPAANTRSGRTRLPPSRLAYRIAACSRWGVMLPEGSRRSRVASMRAWTADIQARKSPSMTFIVIGVWRRIGRTFTGCGCEGLQHFAFQDPDLLLRRLELSLAKARELQAA